MPVSIQKDIRKLYEKKLLPKLLKDHTTGRNITWATDAYEDEGEFYRRDAEIGEPLITGVHENLIRTRAQKDGAALADRTRTRGEVFTPAWLSDRMCGLAESITGDLPMDRYVKLRVLEPACGEAPFLMSRYDAMSGAKIPVADRRGMLDRKLRRISKIVADDIVEWKKWALTAFRSVYGYEYMGDSLLIARVNYVMSYVEHLWAVWREPPEEAEIRRIADLASRNLWQMDGLTGKVPYLSDDAKSRQLNLFDLPPSEDLPEAPECLVRPKVRFNDLQLQENARKRFDIVIGNPPYQQETAKKTSSANGQTPKKNVFHLFARSADKAAKRGTVMIYPLGRWLHRSGKGLDEFGESQLKDIWLKEIVCYPDAAGLFPGVAISDGVGIVVKDFKKTNPGFTYTYVKDGKKESTYIDATADKPLPLDPRDLPITGKLSAFMRNAKLKPVHQRILPRNLFGIESSFVEKHPDAVVPLEGNTVNFDEQVKLFTNDRAGKAGRASWFIADRDAIQSGEEYIRQWQVIVSSANAGGQKRDNQLEIVDNHSAFGRSRVALGSFETQKEAENFFRYMKTVFARYCFLLSDEALSSLGLWVPDLGDYTDGNTAVKFDDTLDEQLFKLTGLSGDEIQYIQTRVDGVRHEGRKRS